MWRGGGEGSEYRSAVETVLRSEGAFFVIVVVVWGECRGVEKL